MSSQKTEHYELNQWLATDQVLRTDFNADNAKIDAALNSLAGQVAGKADAAGLDALSGTVAGHTAQLTQKGNCQIWTTTYTGTGQTGSAHRNQIAFPTVPTMAFVFNTTGDILPLIPGMTGTIYHTSGSGSRLNVVWSGSTVSWYLAEGNYAYAQMNSSGVLYRVVALYQAAA